MIRAGGIIVRQRGTRDPPGRQRRHRQGPHAVRAGRRQGVVPHQGRAPAQVRERRAGHGSRIATRRTCNARNARRARGFFRPMTRDRKVRATAARSTTACPIAIAVKNASGNTAENSGGQSFSTPRFENSRPIRKNERPSIVPAKMRKPTPPCAPLEMRERQRQHHHHQHGERDRTPCSRTRSRSATSSARCCRARGCCRRACRARGAPAPPGRR